MGFGAWLRKILKKKLREEVIESASTSLEEGPQALRRAPASALKRLPEDLEAFQLGLAAGYTGRSLREIERSLTRIEAQMVTRDWFSTEFEDKTPELLKALKTIHQLIEKHETMTEKRFQSIESSLRKLVERKRASLQILRKAREIKPVRKQIPLAPKMQKLLEIVMEAREISYDDLGARLGITTSALRGLLSNMLKRTNKIKRFIRERKGWVRYVEAL
jgi:hypothetical protein